LVTDVVLSALGRILARALIVVLIAGIFSTTLVRFAPGFFSSEESLDYRLAPDTLAALRKERAAGANPLRFFVDYSSSLLRGQAGRSVVFGRPVNELIRRRSPVTLATVGWGLVLGWTVAVLVATISALARWGPLSYAFAFAGSSLAALPAVVLATFCVLFGLPPAIALAALIFPRVYAHAFAQLRAARLAPHVLAARARGLRPLRTFLFHVTPAALWPIIALAGVSLPMAFSAVIPVEALSDSPGLGQLAWRAALGRDLPVLVCITLLLAIATVAANGGAEIAGIYLRRGRR
jgi:peptide/nickel transport system permease protein